MGVWPRCWHSFFAKDPVLLIVTVTHRTEIRKGWCWRRFRSWSRSDGLLYFFFGSASLHPFGARYFTFHPSSALEWESLFAIPFNDPNTTEWTLLFGLLTAKKQPNGQPPRCFRALSAIPGRQEWWWFPFYAPSVRNSQNKKNTRYQGQVHVHDWKRLPVPIATPEWSRA